MEARTTARRGHTTNRIEGSYRPITVHQLTLAWWLTASGLMARRQLRVWFALHEMAERRRYAEKGRQPLYTLEELAAFVGGRGGGDRTLARLRADLRQLEKLGMASMSPHTIAFARSADQIRVDDLSGFWELLEQMPNRRRSVPVPRRMIRALAAGFSKATTALIFTILIRCLFWHKESDSYGIDGRYKLAWVSEVFGVSRRQLTEARSILIDLGWITPLEVPQWMRNRWGVHDVIDPAWSYPKPCQMPANDDQQSASPSAEIDRDSASPDQTGSLSLSGDLDTRRPAPMRAGPSGVSPSSTKGSRKKRRTDRESSGGAPPNLRDIRPEDFASTERMLELHAQACRLGLSSASEAGRMEFLSFAERARSRGKRAGALLFWLLRERKSAFITLSDEDEAARRLREHRNRGPNWVTFDETLPPAPEPEPFTDQDRFVSAVLRVAQANRVDDPYRLARMKRQITRDEWDAMHTEFQMRQVQRWRSTDASSAGLEEF